MNKIHWEVKKNKENTSNKEKDNYCKFWDNKEYKNSEERETRLRKSGGGSQNPVENEQTKENKLNN